MCEPRDDQAGGGAPVAAEAREHREPALGGVDVARACRRQHRFARQELAPECGHRFRRPRDPRQHLVAIAQGRRRERAREVVLQEGQVPEQFHALSLEVHVLGQFDQRANQGVAALFRSPRRLAEVEGRIAQRVKVLAFAPRLAVHAEEVGGDRLVAFGRIDVVIRIGEQEFLERVVVQPQPLCGVAGDEILAADPQDVVNRRRGQPGYPGQVRLRERAVTGYRDRAQQRPEPRAPHLAGRIELTFQKRTIHALELVRDVVERRVVAWRRDNLVEDVIREQEVALALRSDRRGQLLAAFLGQAGEPDQRIRLDLVHAGRGISDEVEMRITDERRHACVVGSGRQDEADVRREIVHQLHQVGDAAVPAERQRLVERIDQHDRALIGMRLCVNLQRTAHRHVEHRSRIVAVDLDLDVLGVVDNAGHPAAGRDVSGVHDDPVGPLLLERLAERGEGVRQRFGQRLHEWNRRQRRIEAGLAEVHVGEEAALQPVASRQLRGSLAHLGEPRGDGRLAGVPARPRAGTRGRRSDLRATG